MWPPRTQQLQQLQSQQQMPVQQKLQQQLQQAQQMQQQRNIRPTAALQNNPGLRNLLQQQQYRPQM